MPDQPPVVTPAPPPPSPPPAPVPPSGPPAGSTFVAAGIDSLTAGGGDVWRKFFVEQVRGGLGDGGPGYSGFSQWAAGEQGATMMLGGLKEFAIGDRDGKLSIDGNGVAIDNGDGTAFLHWTPASAWKQARVYYLKQPGGGTMACHNGAANGATVAATDTNAAAIGLGHLDVGIGAGVAGRTIQCTRITGKVALFGTLVTLKPGLIMASWALGGRSLAQVAAQDGPMRRAWFAELKPSIYFLNAGSNDNNLPAARFRSDLETVVTDIVKASPTTALYIVQPNELAVVGNYFEFLAVRQELATRRGLRFVDVRAVIGNYEQAVANGYIVDGVHPTFTANPLIGRYLAEQSGLASPVLDPGPTRYAE